MIWYSKSRDTLNFIESSGVNIDEEIKNVIDTRRTVFDIKKVLNECIIEKYLYPIKYNDMNNITRFFEVEFLTYEQLQEIDNWDKKIGTIHADGVFFSVIIKDESEYKNSIDIINKINDRRAIFAIIDKIIDIESERQGLMY